VVQPTKGDAQSHAGELVSRALLPAWVPAALAVLCLAAAAILLMIWNGLNTQSAHATQTAVAQVTSLAVVVQGTSQAGTATALALANANVATQQAATVTATWLEADDDRDGLVNRQELELGTLPQLGDTDSDGVRDGDEVARSLNPIDDDSDDDILKDGDEIRLGTDPLIPDTDGDGAVDGRDPDPLQLPTATPDAQGTAAAIAAQTAAAQNATQAFIATQAQATANQAAAYAKATADQATANAKATAKAISATQTAQASRRLAYIYASDTSHQKNFTALLIEAGWQVDSILMGSITATDFSKYDLILIGHETGSISTWGTTPEQVSAITSTSKPIVGIGEGGYAFFGKMGLGIGYPNAAHGSCSQVKVLSPASQYWKSPQAVSIPGDRLVTLYSNNGECVVVFAETQLMGFDYVAHQASDSRYYPVILQDRYLLWGFDTGPKNMTSDGEKLFVNLVAYLLP
jgi:hypothetical protein